MKNPRCVVTSCAALGLALSFASSSLMAQPPAATPPPADTANWAASEGRFLTDLVQLTSREAFIKAGEAYFSPDGQWIIFQAIPVPPPGQDPETFYQMYVAKLARCGSGTVTGIEEPIRLSAPGTSNTCGWFHPTQPGRVLFGSTLTTPSMRDVPGYQRTTGRYVWQFHSEMETVTRFVEPMWRDMLTRAGQTPGPAPREPDFAQPVPVFTRPEYCAEASWSHSGRFILYANFDRTRSEGMGRNHLDINIFDTQTKAHYPIVIADGYNGGPFFSPDDSWITYRSDREGNNNLQIFVAPLRYVDGVPNALADEYQLTNNGHVNWAPFWHPSGRFLVYTSSEEGHRNYEVFAIEVDKDKLRAGATPADIPYQRVTFATGADVLPVFSPDGREFMWTAQRGPLGPGESRPSSQIWIARWIGGEALPLGAASADSSDPKPAQEPNR